MIPLLLCFLPGAALLSPADDSAPGWLSGAVLVSLVVNSCAFLVAGAAGVFAPGPLTAWVALWTVVLALRWGPLLARGELHFARVPALPEALVGGAVLLVAAWWAWRFPPALWDSLYYHLPIARILASPRLLHTYSVDLGREGMLLRGATGANLVERFLAAFFVAGAPTWRLVPPILGAAWVVATMELGRRVGLGRPGRVACALLLLSAPGVLMQISDYHVDFVLGALATEAIRRLLRAWDTGSRRDLLVAAVLLGGGALTKVTGAVLVAVPLLGGLLRSRRPPVRDLVWPSAAAALLALPYWIHRAGLPPFPGLAGHMSVAAFVRGIHGQGIRALLTTRTPEALGAHLVLLFAVLLLGRLLLVRWHEIRRVDLLAALVLGWTLVCLAAIAKADRPDFFGYWSRYLLPAVGLAAVWVVWTARRLAFGAHPRGVALAGAAIVATAGTAWAVEAPFGRLAALAFDRYPPLSWALHTTRDERWRLVWGESAEAWAWAAKLARQRGVATLSSDTRILRLMDGGIVYDAWSIPPGTDSPGAVRAWLRAHDVGILVESTRPDLDFAASDRERHTALAAFVHAPDAPVVARRTFGEDVVWVLAP